MSYKSSNSLRGLMCAVLIGCLALTCAVEAASHFTHATLGNGTTWGSGYIDGSGVEHDGKYNEIGPPVPLNIHPHIPQPNNSSIVTFLVEVCCESCPKAECDSEQCGILFTFDYTIYGNSNTIPPIPVPVATGSKDNHADYGTICEECAEVNVLVIIDWNSFTTTPGSSYAGIANGDAECYCCDTDELVNYANGYVYGRALSELDD